MWLLEGGGAIVRRRKRVKLESRGSIPLSGGFLTGVCLSWAETKGKMTIAKLPLSRVKIVPKCLLCVSCGRGYCNLLAVYRKVHVIDCRVCRLGKQ